MARRLSQVLGTRRSASGMHSQSARGVRRVARAGSIMGGSSGDWWPMGDSTASPLRPLESEPDTASFARHAGPLRALTSLIPPTHLYSRALQYPRLALLPKTSAHTSSVPRNPPYLSRTYKTHTHILQYNPRTRRYSLHSHLILLYYTDFLSLVQTVSLCASLLFFPLVLPYPISICCPSFSLGCISFLIALALVTVWSVLSLFFFSSSLFSLRDSHLEI
jgi:hypothetical protein